MEEEKQSSMGFFRKMFYGEKPSSSSKSPTSGIETRYDFLIENLFILEYFVNSFSLLGIFTARLSIMAYIKSLTYV